MLYIDTAVSTPVGSAIFGEENIDPPDRHWDPENIILYADPEQSNPAFKGTTLLHRIKLRNRALDAGYLDWLLENPEEIPSEWAKSSDGDDQYIFFWGTQYARTTDRQGYIRYLYQTDNGLWREGRHFLNDPWPPSCVAAEWKI